MKPRLIQRIVLDTNVLVSAVLSEKGNCARIVKAWQEDKYDLYYNQEIFSEYQDVLLRDCFHFDRARVLLILDDIKKHGILVLTPKSVFAMADETDRAFYDMAKTADAYLVTGNLKHYPRKSFIVPPAAFLQISA